MFLARLSHNSVVIISSISLERRLYRNQTLNLLIWSLADTFRWRWPIFVLVTYFTLFRKLSIFILESDNPSRKTWESNVEYVLLCVSYFVWYKEEHLGQVRLIVKTHCVNPARNIIRLVPVFIPEKLSKRRIARRTQLCLFRFRTDYPSCAFLYIRRTKRRI